MIRATLTGLVLLSAVHLFAVYHTHAYSDEPATTFTLPAVIGGNMPSR